MTAEEKLQTLEKRKAQKKKEQEMHGIWITELYRFSIANKVWLDYVFIFYYMVFYNAVFK